MKRDKLIWLIEYLLKERGEKRDLDLDIDSLFEVYRGLVNIREPNRISEEYLSLEDEFLTDLNSKRLIADAKLLKETQKGISLWQGDITRISADAIVNAANEKLLGCMLACHDCIDNFIHTYSGIRLRLYMNDIMKKQGYLEPTGKAKISPGFNLPSKYIIHTVGPIVSGKVSNQNQDDLKSSYKNSMILADQNGLENIVFCSISTGVFGYPKKEAAGIAYEMVIENLKEMKNIKKVVFNVFSDEDRKIYEKILNE
ncbi:MAG: protein-ADP-ribose hydrolase [Tissierellia bacterium]|nr:protein-ADP-ribose hydrolase [Tissierellia bacterium]